MDLEGQNTLKTQNFLWLGQHDRLPTNLNLYKRGVKLNSNCVVCNHHQETTPTSFLNVLSSRTSRQLLSSDHPRLIKPLLVNFSHQTGILFGEISSTPNLIGIWTCMISYPSALWSSGMLGTLAPSITKKTLPTSTGRTPKLSSINT